MALNDAVEAPRLNACSNDMGARPVKQPWLVARANTTFIDDDALMCVSLAPPAHSNFVPTNNFEPAFHGSHFFRTMQMSFLNRTFHVLCYLVPIYSMVVAH